MKIGYILKRFPRASETFIAQEILGLERLGVEVVVFALRPNDQLVQHDWLEEIEAPVLTFEPQSFSACWRDLQERAKRGADWRQSSHDALLAAFDHPKRSGKRYLVEAWWIAELANELGVQHLHAHFANHPTFVAMLAHVLGDLSYSFTAHAKDIYLDSPREQLWRQQLERASFAVTVSHCNRQYLGSQLGSRAMSKLCTLYNGIDLERISPARRSSKNGTPRVTFAGRLVEKKGADILVGAIPRLLRRHPDLKISLVGDGPERPKLERKARSLGVAGSLVFEGMLPHQQTVARITESDLFVLPCRVAADGDRDALPTVLLEAMAAGVPCISTPVNGVPEIIEQGRTGLIVTENDVVGLAAAIDHLLADSSSRRYMGIEARRSAERKFDLRMSTSRLRSLYESAISKTHNSRQEETALAV